MIPSPPPHYGDFGKRLVRRQPTTQAIVVNRICFLKAFNKRDLTKPMLKFIIVFYNILINILLIFSSHIHLEFIFRHVGNLKPHICSPSPPTPTPHQHTTTTMMSVLYCNTGGITRQSKLTDCWKLLFYSALPKDHVYFDTCVLPATPKSVSR